jgi:hypothetical protein
MAKRKEHLFQFTAEAIAKAAASEAAYHSKRATWWDAEFNKAAEEAKVKGVEIRHYPVTGGNRAQVVIDATLQQRIEEAARKRTEHQQKAERFTIESASYGSQLEKTVYALDGEDVMYFRLAGGQREDEAPTPFV